MAVPNITDLNNLFNQLKIRATKAIQNKIDSNTNRLEAITSKQILKNPLSIYEIKEQKLDNLLDRLQLFITSKIKEDDLKYHKIIDNKLFKEPIKILENKEYQFNILLNTITVLNPMKLLESGYSIVKNKDEVITSVKLVKVNDNIDINLKDGNIKAKVVSKEIKND